MHEYTYAEIDAMRAKLAKLWRQTIDQVTESEARYYLRRAHSAGAEHE
jgi:hypothetical protein